MVFFQLNILILLQGKLVLAATATHRNIFFFMSITQNYADLISNYVV
jgi:hypothetical protein